RPTKKFETRIRRPTGDDPTHAEVAPGMSLEYLKLAQLAAGQTRVQAGHKPQGIRPRVPRVWMNHEQGLQGSGGCLIGELAYEAHDVAVQLKRVVESEVPDLEPYRLPEASRARERANGETAEDFVRLLDELLRPSEDSIEDSAFSAGDDGCSRSHRWTKRATEGPRGCGARRLEARCSPRGTSCAVQGPHARTVSPARAPQLRDRRLRRDVPGRLCRGHRVGRARPPLRLFRYVAATPQHGHDDRHVSHGFHHPERTEPRRPGDATQARRAHSRRQGSQDWDGTTRRDDGSGPLCARGGFREAPLSTRRVPSGAGRQQHD